MAEKSAPGITKDIIHNSEAVGRDTALQTYADNQPYNKERVIREGLFFLTHIAAAKFELGKRLLILKEFESVRTFAQILQDHFQGMSTRSAYEYMAFAKKCMDLPKLKSFGEENWSKVLTLLNSCTDEQLREIEDKGIDGKVLDEYDGLSVREFKRLLTQYKSRAEKTIGKQVSKLEERLSQAIIENRKLRAQIDGQTPKQITESIRTAEQLIKGVSDIFISIDIASSLNGNTGARRKFQARLKKLRTQIDGIIEVIA